MTKELLGKIKEMEEKLGPEWIKELEGLKTTEALKMKATELKISLTDEMATQALALLKDEADELSEEELTIVAGGAKN